MATWQADLARTRAIQEIEYLRRQYARATDLIGEASEESVAKGREVYRRIFATDARLSTGVDDVIGPDAWALLVLGVLEPLGPTQHLIGTQLVEIRQLDVDDDGAVTHGSATMESYVQAWHEMPDDRVWLYLGTYVDEVAWTPGIGWQIVGMTMKQASGETRYRDGAVGGSR